MKTYGHSHFWGVGVEAAAAAGFGVVQATHSRLSGPLLTSHTEQIQVPSFGLNMSRSDGCVAPPFSPPASLFSSFAAGFSTAAGLAPKLKDGDAESAFPDWPNANAGFASEDALPNAKPVDPASPALAPNEKPVVAVSVGLAPNENPVAAGLAASDPEPKTGFASATGWTGEEKEKVLLAADPKLKFSNEGKPLTTLSDYVQNSVITYPKQILLLSCYMYSHALISCLWRLE
jgi:hypothetical protein